MTIARQDIAGLVLAGGRGSRMGGVDKGLQLHRGVPLARHALERLAPQVGAVAINANRHLDIYAAMGVAVWPDADAGFAGPLAGWLAGLTNGSSPWLVTVACDTPNFPLDLVARLSAAALEQQADIAMASGLEDGRLRTQPVFCLLRRALRDDLAAALQAGVRKIDAWTARQRCVTVPFDDPEAFVNLNTFEDLSRLQSE